MSVTGHMCVCCPRRPEESFGCLGISVRDSEMLCGSCELDLGPLEEQPVLLTPKPSLQSQNN